MNINQLIMSIDIKLSQNKSSYSLGLKITINQLFHYLLI